MTIRFLAAALALFFAAPSAATPLLVDVDVSEQRMIVYQDGMPIHEWDVSTARPGKVTPRGAFEPYFLSRHHRSSLYDDAPMPFAIFFDGDYAIHGTNALSRLGTPVSAGCVRLAPDHAALLFDHVIENGMDALQIQIRD